MSTTTIGPTPTMSWSHSRARLLEEDCARRYYWQYYGSHGGWDAEAPDETRLAYRLKQLSALDMALGQEIHTRAQEIAEAIRGREEPPSLDRLIERTRNELNRVWRASKDPSAFARAPKRQPMLLERYYGLSVSNDRLAVSPGQARECVTNLADLAGMGGGPSGADRGGPAIRAHRAGGRSGHAALRGAGSGLPGSRDRGSPRLEERYRVGGRGAARAVRPVPA